MNILNFFINRRQLNKNAKIAQSNKEYFKTHGKTRRVKVTSLEGVSYMYLPVWDKAARKQLRDEQGKFTK